MKIIGHRGAMGIAPENTLKSIEKAIEHQVDEIEFDLRVTGDGVVVLHHDASVENENGNKLKISESTYNDLRRQKPDLATFKSVLQNFGNVIPYYVEVKADVPTQPIIDIIETYINKGWQPESFLLASFSQKTLLELHEKLPMITKIVNENWSTLKATRRAKQLGTKRISMHERWVWYGYIKAMRRNGWQLSAYTVNNPIRAQRWQKYGIYGIVTNYPDVLDG